MVKRCKKSPSDKKMAKDYKSVNFNMSFADRWKWTCEATKDKYNTVTPQHNALQPASPEFLKNYEDIDWGHNKETKE